MLYGGVFYTTTIFCLYLLLEVALVNLDRMSDNRRDFCEISHFRAIVIEKTQLVGFLSKDGKFAPLYIVHFISFLSRYHLRIDACQYSDITRIIPNYPCGPVSAFTAIHRVFAWNPTTCIHGYQICSSFGKRVSHTVPHFIHIRRTGNVNVPTCQI